MRKDLSLILIEGDVVNVDFREHNKIAISLSILSLRQWIKNDIMQERRTWFRATEFGRRAEALRDRIEIGHRVRIEGHFMPGDDGNPKIWVTPAGRSASCYELKIRSCEILNESTPSQNTGKSKNS